MSDLLFLAILWVVVMSMLFCAYFFAEMNEDIGEELIIENDWRFYSLMEPAFNLCGYDKYLFMIFDTLVPLSSLQIKFILF